MTGVVETAERAGHFSCERETIVGKAGPFSVERLQNGPGVCECFVCAQTSTQRSAGPLALLKGSGNT